MTFEQLMEIYYAAKFKTPSVPDPEGGVRAVVEALRDEYTAKHALCETVHTSMSRYDFNEILGDAGSDAARKAYWDKHYGVDEPTAPATDPAPAERSDATAVCEWTREHNLPGSGWFDCGGNRHWIKSECPCCGLPIKFTEAK